MPSPLIEDLEKKNDLSIFNNTSNHKHEQVTYCYDEYTGLKAIVAIHSTVLGPALGGHTDLELYYRRGCSYRCITPF